MKTDVTLNFKKHVPQSLCWVMSPMCMMHVKGLLVMSQITLKTLLEMSIKTQVYGHCFSVIVLVINSKTMNARLLRLKFLQLLCKGQA